MPTPSTILLAIGDGTMGRRLVRIVEKAGYRGTLAGDGLEAYRLLQQQAINVVLLDLDLPRMDGLELLQAIALMELVTPVVALVAPGVVDRAVAAMKLGAFECLTKPPRPQTVLAALADAFRIRPAPPPTRGSELVVFERMIAVSPRMKEVFALIERVAPTDASVLIQGESGTGKELVARALHDRSGRRGRRFFAINCAAVPRDLLENEFFGHERGAFTGALERRQGAFELANGGTIFLDEIDEMPFEVQAKLLRVLEEKSFRRLGGRDEVDVDVRIVAATDKVVEDLIRASRFKEELFFRLNVVRLRLPSLRDRPEDIGPLVRAFVKECNEAAHRRVRDLSPRAWQLMRSYPWPGNVRELRNAVERAVIAATGPVILPKHLPPRLRGTTQAPRTFSLPLGGTLAEAERAFIDATLEYCHGNRSRTARLLGIGRRTLQKKLRAAGSESPRPGAP